MLDALPGIIKSCPNAIYVILGATHPNLVRDQGEAYRDRLTARVRELGIGITSSSSTSSSIRRPSSTSFRCATLT